MKRWRAVFQGVWISEVPCEVEVFLLLSLRVKKRLGKSCLFEKAVVHFPNECPLWAGSGTKIIIKTKPSILQIEPGNFSLWDNCATHSHHAVLGTEPESFSSVRLSFPVWGTSRFGLKVNQAGLSCMVSSESSGELLAHGTCKATLSQSYGPHNYIHMLAFLHSLAVTFFPSHISLKWL